MTAPKHESDDPCRSHISVDDTDLQEAMRIMAPVPYYKDEAHLIEVTRESLRRCWDRDGEAPGEYITIGGHAWLLWLTRAETAERKPQSDEPLAAFSIDRSEDDG